MKSIFSTSFIKLMRRQWRPRRLLQLAALLGLIATVCACESLAWYGQAARGQYELLSKAKPVDALLADSTTPDTLKQQLQLAQQLVSFAHHQLQLPLEGKFEKYVELGRPYAVWNVFAAEEFSVNAKPWCYFVVGCVSYRGYFDEAAAEAKAEDLREQHYEVYVGGVAAYSTLGWFDDPLLSSFIERDELSLARLIFHELAHSKLFIKGDTLFNESYAEAVAEIGVESWIANKGDDATRYAEASERRRTIREGFNGLLLETRAQLDQIYRDTTLNDAAKRQQKQGIYDQLQENYEAFKRETGIHYYDNYMHAQMNNAKLAIVADYQTLVPAFTARYEQIQAEGGGLQAFYAWAQSLQDMDLELRHMTLEALLPAEAGKD